MKLTKKQAKEWCIKKWKHIVEHNGSDEELYYSYPEIQFFVGHCGYCQKYDEDCLGCPLNLDGITCSRDGHPWEIWLHCKTKENAQAVLDLILKS